MNLDIKFAKNPNSFKSIFRKNKSKSEYCKEWRWKNPRYDKEYYQEHKEVICARLKKRYKEDPKYQEKLSTRKKKYRNKIKEIVLNHYGHKCDCCGEDRTEFLILSHIDNDGAKQRKDLFGTNTGGRTFYRWLIKNNFPNDIRLQILCWNCNSAMALYGYCPHMNKEG